MSLVELFAHPGMATGDRYAEVLEAFEEVSLTTLDDHKGLDDVLLLVGRRLCELIGVSRCSVYLRRRDGLFQARTGCEQGASIRASVCHLVSGMDSDLFTKEILATQQPTLITDVRRDPRPVQSAMRRFGIRDILGVPLIVGGSVIGIIYVDNQEAAHDYQDHEIGIAQAFASLAAVAVHQHKLRFELQRHATVIDRQRATVEHLSDTHNKLNQAVLAGADIPALLDLIRGLVGKPVLLYDCQLNLLEWSASGDLGMSEPPSLNPAAKRMPWVQQLITQARNSNAATVVPPAPELGSPTRRLWYPLHLEDRFGGLLEVVEFGQRFSALEEQVLERAAVAVGMRLLAEQHRQQSLDTLQQDAVADAIQGRHNPHELTRRLSRVGVSRYARYLILRVTYVTGQPDLGSRSRRDTVCQQMQALDGVTSVFGTTTPEADHFILHLADRTQPHDILADLRSGTARFVGLGAQYLVVSSLCADLANARERAHELADTVRAFNALGAPPQVASVADLQVVRLVARGDCWRGVREFVDANLGDLCAADEDGRLLETARAYVTTGGRVRDASEVLDVHENTVRYRMKRIREITGIDTDDIKALTILQLALQLRELLVPDVS